MTARGSRGSSLAVSVLVTLLAVAGAIVLVIRLPGRAGEMADKAAAQPLAVSASPAPVSPSAAGVAWTAAGENIGEGGPVADTGRRSPRWPSG